MVLVFGLAKDFFKAYAQNPIFILTIPTLPYIVSCIKLIKY